MRKPNAVLQLALLLAVACGADEKLTSESPARDPDAMQIVPAETISCPVMVNDKNCDADKRPILFIHGSTSAGDSFAHPAQLFASNGYCALRIRAIDYDAISGDEPLAAFPAVEAQITHAMDELIDLTGSPQIDLVAHAQGAIHAARYVAAHPDKIAHYVHLAGGQLSANPGNVNTLCLSSVGDRPVDCSTTKNVTFEDPTLDHFAVCSSREAFVEMYTFLNDAAPQYESVQCGDPVVIEGRAVSFGDNERMAGGKIEVYALGADPRDRAQPLTTLEVREDGGVGPWTVQRGVAYEFKLFARDGDGRVTRYAYFRPWNRSDRLLRFTFESRNPSSLMTSSMANLSDGTAALWVRRRQGAFLNGRDRLLVDGYDAINDQDAMLRASVLGLYVLDQDGDQRSSGGSVLRQTFVSGTDVYLQTERPAFIEVDLNGQKLRIPNWPSRSGGLSMVWFD
jgi:pimeloyl-ACP methyl ester carboxylesterase